MLSHSVMDCHPPGSSVHGISPGMNTAVGCCALPQGIFPTQGWIPGLSSQVDSLPSEPPEKPTHTHRMLNISLKTLPTRKIL